MNIAPRRSALIAIVAILTLAVAGVGWAVAAPGVQTQAQVDLPGGADPLPPKPDPVPSTPRPSNPAPSNPAPSAPSAPDVNEPEEPALNDEERAALAREEAAEAAAARAALAGDLARFAAGIVAADPGNVIDPALLAAQNLVSGVVSGEESG